MIEIRILSELESNQSLTVIQHVFEVALTAASRLIIDIDYAATPRSSHQ